MGLFYSPASKFNINTAYYKEPRLDKIIRIEKHGKYWIGTCELYGVSWLSCSRFKFLSKIQIQYTLEKVEKFYQYWKSWGYVSISETEPEDGQEISYVSFEPPYLSHR